MSNLKFLLLGLLLVGLLYPRQRLPVYWPLMALVERLRLERDKAFEDNNTQGGMAYADAAARLEKWIKLGAS